MVSEVLCDRRVPIKLKGKFNKAVRSALLCGLLGGGEKWIIPFFLPLESITAGEG